MGRATDHTASPNAGQSLQLKVRLLEVSPMVWRPLLVPVDTSLRGLHGILLANDNQPNTGRAAAA